MIESSVSELEQPPKIIDSNRLNIVKIQTHEISKDNLLREQTILEETILEYEKRLDKVNALLDLFKGV